MEVRAVRAQDAEAVAGLLGELGYPDAPGRVAVRLAAFTADASSRVLVAAEDGDVVGLASLTILPLLHEDGSWCRVSALVVTAAARRRGVGRALLEAAERHGREHGSRYVEITSGEGPRREAAHRLYESLGYEQVSRRFLKPL